LRRADHHQFLVGAEAIVLRFDRVARAGKHQVLAVHQGAHLLAGGVAVLVDGLLVAHLIEHGVVFSIVHAGQAAHMLAIEGGAVPDLLVGEWLLGEKWSAP
jgi:hypothetical protein